MRNYDRLFAAPNPANVEEGEDYRKNLNPKSLEVLTGLAEAHLGGVAEGVRLQFERMGYYVIEQSANGGGLIVNRTVTLRDSWAKEVAKD